MGSIKLSGEALEMIYRRYQEDTFILGCTEQIRKAIELSTPCHVMDLTTGKIEIKKDEETRKKIQFWLDTIDEYKKANYPEIVPPETTDFHIEENLEVIANKNVFNAEIMLNRKI